MVTRKKTTVFRQLLINMILPLMATLLLLAYFNYNRNKTLLIAAREEKNLGIQNEIINVLSFQDISLESVEKHMEKYMRTMSDILITEFLNDPDSIEGLPLEEIRHNLGMKDDIYVINRQGIIVNTTFIRDLDLNLFDIDEKHKQFLLEIMDGGEFVSEKLSLERNTKRLKKFTYQPTLDGNYILELGSYNEEANGIVDFYRKHLEKLSDLGSGIQSVDIFLGRDDPVSFIRDSEINPEHQDLYIEAFDNKEERSITEKHEKKSLDYDYIYLKREKTDLYEGVMLRIITDRSGEKKVILRELQRLLLIFGLSLVLLAIVIYKRAQSITRPIHQLAENAIKIEEGDIDIRAEIVGNNEITSLAEHFNAMMERLANYYSELEQKVAERTTEVVQQKEEIERQKLSLTDSILYAKRIQNAMLPSDSQMGHALNDYFLLYWPKDIVSGDFYWMSTRKNKVFLTTVDCTGHGVPGAFMSMIGSSLLNKIVNENEVYQPAEVLNKLKEGVVNALNKEGAEESTSDGMDMSFISLDIENRKVEFAGANNPLYIFRDGEILIFKGDKQPVGAFITEDKPFTNHEVELKNGDVIYIFSDGFQDQFGGVKKTKFMVGKFKKLLVELGPLPMEEQKKQLTETYHNWKGEIGQVDDIVIIGIRI